MRCVKCKSKYPALSRLFLCPRCGSPLEPYYRVSGSPHGRGVWRYSDLLPKTKSPVSMGEGGTPLVKLENLSRSMGVDAFAKLELSNPTGSFKDRGMSVAVSLARDMGFHRTIAASTGNTAASMAAYSRRAGLKPVVVIPRGGVASGKLVQIAALGTDVIELEGGFDECLDVASKAFEAGIAYSLNSINPYRLEGQKTIAFEVLEELGDSIDHVVVPVGNAGNMSAIWKGFIEAPMLGLPRAKPRMVGVQADGAAPLAKAWASGSMDLEPVEKPRTIASAIRIGRPVNYYRALKAARESGGLVTSVSDREIFAALKDLAVNEGILVEPASAASLAGLQRLLRTGWIREGSTVVLILTGHGLKDPDALAKLSNISVGSSRVAGSVGEALDILKRG